MSSDESPAGGSEPRTVTVEIELTRPVAEQATVAGALAGQSLHEFIDEAILTRLQAVDNILHDESEIDLPDDFDPEAWRERYQHIREVELYE